MRHTASDEEAVKEGCHFSEEHAERATRFIETYCTPSTLGTTITLLPWQRDLVRSLFGWRRGDRPRFRRATISTAKKNGKTVLLSALLLYGMLGGITSSPFVVSASTSRENASQVYRELAHSIRTNAKLDKLCRCLDSYKEVRCRDKNARYRAFSADAGASEGENISLCCIDEVHAHVSDRLYRSLEYSSIARPEGLFVNISTAGSDLGHFWYETFRFAQQVQSGDIIDTTLLPYICTPDESDDIEDPKTWRKSNPSLGVSFSEEDFRRDYQRAKTGGTADLISWKRYRLNQWTTEEDAFIDGAKWDRCLAPMTDAELRNYPLYVGADLSMVTDPSSVACCWVLPDRKFYVKSHAWVCEQGVRNREQTNLPKYQLFAADDVMSITKGDCIDLLAVRKFIEHLRQNYNLKECVFDSYNCIEMAGELMNQGITVFRQPQNHKHYTAPCKDFSVAVDEGRIKHDGNRLLRWCLINTRLDVDSYGNCKPDRASSTEKIDAAVATLMAFGRAVTASVANRPSVYETRGLRIIKR
jgi:phage terminase large subunit-like protein